nr:RHS repeat protein [Chitinophagales bacterium]
ALFQIRGQSCFKLYSCCQNQNAPATPALCCVPVMPKFDVIPTCLRDAEAVANNNRARDETDRLTAAIDSFRIKYIARCLGAAEELNAAYTDAIYQITLMYYDRSGQLVKTVPPMGVKTFNAAQVAGVRQARSTGSGFTYPAHTMATTYRYNSLNQVVETTSPDEGTKRFCYDENGRSIMSQDATQLAANACSYTLYDEMGRVLESGRMSFSGSIPSFNSYGNFKTALATSAKSEFKKRKYDEMPAAVVSKFPATPKNLRNRLVAVEAYEATGNLQHAMYFDYDALGNTKNLVQNFKGISAGDGSKFWKKVNYDYNPVSGKVKRVWYQKGNTDQLIHWYQYDADGRMISAQTGTNPNELEILRETEARYFYYPHGPLARTEIGTEKVQGIDYAYTINGLLKGINSGNASADFDMGEDGKPEGILHGHFPADAFGEALNYFDNDYRAVSSSAVAFNTATAGALQTGFSLPVYNGFIRNTISTIPGIDTKPQARAFKYDQAGRFSQMQTIFDLGAVTSNSISAGFTEDYKMQLTYDANGNIKTLLRNKNGGAAMDNMTYQYGTANNQLLSLDDAIGNSADASDIDDQSANNYTYDGCGRLKTDAAAGVSEMLWNNAGNIKRIAKAGGNTEYGYDAFNRRAWKKDGGNTDFYVRDAKGNLLATYRANGSAVTCNTLDIYGDTRLGQYELNKEVESTTTDTGSFKRGLKRYELTNHIGDVQVVVSDKRALVSGIVKADVVSASDYYPFGMPMPGRKAGSRNYQYGFQSMECDDAVAGDNNEYNTEFRQYDPRVARWMSVDPKAGNFFALSPYNAMLNNAVNFSDSKGADPTEDRTRGVRLRPEDDRMLREMLEWGDDPIAGIEDPPVDAIDALCINLRRLEGNDDPLAGLPMEDASEPAPARRRTGHRRHRDGTAEILRVDEAPFEDEHVEGRAPRTRPTRTSREPDRPDGVAITREAFANAGNVMDAGGLVNDVVTVARTVNDARSAGEALTVTSAAGTLMSGGGAVSGMGLLGAGISVVNMVGDIYDDANALVDGDIGVGTYAARSTCNVVGGTVGVVPLIGAPISRGIGYFRDWVAPRPPR